MTGPESRMPDLVETVIEDEHWTALDLGARAEAACRAVLAELDLPAEEYEIALLGCDDARIAGLNADFRDKPTPTNVLSWPADDLAAEEDGDDPWLPPEAPAGERLELGDIAIAWETCEREAEDQGKPLRDHVSHLIVHATLHLLGYDHVRDGDAALMEGTEIRILEAMGLSNPYE